MIAPRLQKDFDHITILIDGTAEIVLLTVNFHEEFVDIPGIAETPLSLLETFRIVGPELPAPSSDGFIETMMPRSARRSSMSRKLMQKR